MRDLTAHQLLFRYHRLQSTDTLDFRTFWKATRDARFHHRPLMSTYRCTVCSLNFATGYVWADTVPLTSSFSTVWRSTGNWARHSASERIWVKSVSGRPPLYFLPADLDPVSPMGRMTEDDWDDRDRWLKGFARWVATYREIRNQ